MWPLGESFSGCSGGPVVLPLLVPQKGKQPSISVAPIGLISRGSKKEPGRDHGNSAKFDIIRVRRISCIRPDGKLDRPADGGWLPS